MSFIASSERPLIVNMKQISKKFTIYTLGSLSYRPLKCIICYTIVIIDLISKSLEVMVCLTMLDSMPAKENLA